jgi:hypothetical protein
MGLGSAFTAYPSVPADSSQATRLVGSSFGRLSPCNWTLARPWGRSADAVTGSAAREATAKRVLWPTHTSAPLPRTAAKSERTSARLSTCLAALSNTSRTALRVHKLTANADTHGRPSSWQPGPPHSRATRNVPSTTTNARPGEAPVWRPGATTRAAPATFQSAHEPGHGRSPVWRADPRRPYARNLPRRTPRVAARLGWSFLTSP